MSNLNLRTPKNTPIVCHYLRFRYFKFGNLGQNKLHLLTRIDLLIFSNIDLDLGPHTIKSNPNLCLSCQPLATFTPSLSTVGPEKT